MWQCSQQHENRDTAKFCGKCGEKRDTQPRCAACRAVLEPEDAFCTSCGHGRDPVPVTAPAPIPADPIPAPEPPKAEAPAPIKAEGPAPIKAEEPEPVTFSFGGATIEMKDDPSKPDRIAKPSAGKRGMNPAVTTVLSFALIAALLWLAFYLVTR